MILADTPSFGLVFGFPIGVIVFFAGLAVFIYGRHMSDAPYSDKPILVWGGPLASALALVITGVAMWPWSHDYHFWKPVNGRVQRISSRFVSAGDKGGTNQRFVVIVNGQPYGVDDTRAALLHPGDTVHLKCKREFVWGSGNNGWGCNWNGSAS